MPLPRGFKVNGVTVTRSKSKLPLPPRAQKAIAVLDKLPLSELLGTMEVSERMGADIHSGGINNHPGLADYRLKVDNKLYWGSRASIALLREKLEETDGD